MVTAIHVSRAVQIFGEYLPLVGIDRADFIEAVGFLHSSDESFHHSVCKVWRSALELVEDDNLGLHTGVSMANGVRGHIFFSMAANSATIGDAIRNLCEYHEIYCHAPHPWVEERKSSVALMLDTQAIDREDDIARHMCECLFSAIITTVRILSNNSILPLEVNFSFPSPKSSLEHRALFGMPVHFLFNENSLVFSRSDLDKKIIFSDPVLLDTLKKHAVEQLNEIKMHRLWISKVEEAIRNSILDNKCDIKSISSQLCISPRTLQNKLKSEGSSFQNITNEIKIGMALRYLKNGNMSLSQIALLMGYSDQSSFTHAFKRWLGKSPRQVREDFFQGRFQNHDLSCIG